MSYKGNSIGCFSHSSIAIGSLSGGKGSEGRLGSALKKKSSYDRVFFVVVVGVVVVGWLGGGQGRGRGTGGRGEASGEGVGGMDGGRDGGGGWGTERGLRYSF